MHAWRWLSFLIAATVGLASIPAQAAIVITGTRVIYPEKSRQVSVRLNNVEDTPVLVQAWIDDGDTSVPVEKINVPFIITPPVFRAEGGKGQTLRIKFTGKPMPADRETVYWLNILEIPPKPVDADSRNMLQLAFGTRIKLFYRPAALRDDPSAGRAGLTWTAARNAEGKQVLRVGNPTAYYVSLDSVSAKAGTTDIGYQPQMVPPFGSVELLQVGDRDVSPPSGTAIAYSLINDFGATVGDVDIVQ